MATPVASWTERRTARRSRAYVKKSKDADYHTILGNPVAMPVDDFDEVERAAEHLRDQLGVPNDERLDMIDLLRRMRIAGLIKDFGVRSDVELCGSLAAFVASSKKIMLSETVANQPASGTNRFTIAHEIGHVIGGHDHTRYRRGVGVTQFGRARAKDEVFANRFAAALLIPEQLAQVSEDTTAHDLMSRFGVTKSVADRRLLDLQRRYRIANGISRKLPGDPVGPARAKVAEKVKIDTGDYEAVFPEMLRNARRSNS